MPEEVGLGVVDVPVGVRLARMIHEGSAHFTFGARVQAEPRRAKSSAPQIRDHLATGAKGAGTQPNSGVRFASA